MYWTNPNIPFSGKLLCNSIPQSYYILNKCSSMDQYQTQSLIHVSLNLLYDNSNNETLETLSNIHFALIKGFVNHHKIRVSRMLPSLTRSD